MNSEKCAVTFVPLHVGHVGVALSRLELDGELEGLLALFAEELVARGPWLLFSDYRVDATPLCG
jgi:hypothetical protein